LSEYEEMWEKLGLNLSRHDELLASIGEAHENIIASQPNRPESMAYFDEAVAVAHCRRAKELLDSKAKGQKIIGTFCIYVPDEIAIAAGVTPVALCGGTQLPIPYAETLFPRDICPLIKSTFGLKLGNMCPYLSIADLAVGETTCDGKKKAWEILDTIVPTHVMEVPQKKEHIDQKLWLSEVALFKDKMEKLSGRKITFNNLLKSVKTINQRREVLAELHGFRKESTLPISGKDVLLVTQVALFDDPERFISKVKALNKELESRVKSKTRVFDGKPKRILIAGCPAVVANWKVHHLIETSGGAVVCDETCTGFRYYANQVDEKATDLKGLIRNIADRYMQISCSCFTPNKERVNNVMDLVKEYHVDGVVQYVLQYCHGYNIEAAKLGQALKAAGIPVLKLETDYSEEDIGPLKTRIEAFMEKLE